MYQKRVDNRKSLYCEFCSQYLFKDDEEYVNYKLVQLKPRQKIYLYPLFLQP